MLLVRIECTDVRIEKLYSYLSKCNASEVKVWVHDKKAYAVLKVKSISHLRNLTSRLRRFKVQFRYTGIRKVSWFNWRIL